ncbi:N-6 DNA methylase, partial [Candidatus Dojkabacteria bacterium]|nr:N-6 DNA methylase [Candidatus Dojkabacteria bacterium]
MNLFNRKILNQRLAGYVFPKGDHAVRIGKFITGWQKSLKDRDLQQTKEKSIQGKFLVIFFEEILGYQDKTKGEEEWTLVAEPKTEVDAQTADGSLGFFSKAKKETKAVIELKDAKTSLDKKQSGREKGYTPVEQAYLYATKFDRCKWIIVSNFREIRLYSKARSEQFVEKFDILELHKEDEFKRFYYLLNKENLLAKEGKSPVEDLAEKSLEQEEDISKKFYADYKNARERLFKHLLRYNKGLDKETLFRKAHKILDRLIFILFCEDSANLLPKELLKDSYRLGMRSRERSDQRVWREIKNLFMDIDEGRDDIEPAINSYNGGLFKKDQILDDLVIKDDVWEDTIHLGDYDFESDLNVNILGHIFEQSISDIENIKAEMSEEKKVSSKRKKEGIFYTPEYITKYIVENTVGRYIEENPGKLEDIKILDPACGSGAFLNQAHSFLLNEYKVRHEQKMAAKKKKGQELTLFDYNPAEANRSILLNNLFGVDLNEESVEITKLALWLKTARTDEPLQNLDNNIKVGNSLINDLEVAKRKAFDWRREFKTIMRSGGFDVIIGNPPWGAVFSDVEKSFLRNRYPQIKGELNSYLAFILESLSKLNVSGLLGFIVPDGWTESKRWEEFRNDLIDNFKIEEINLFRKNIFIDAPDVIPTIIIIRKDKIQSNKVSVQRIGLQTDISLLQFLDWKDKKFLEQKKWKNNPYSLITINQTASLMPLYERLYSLEKVSDPRMKQEERNFYISDGVYKSKLLKVLKEVEDGDDVKLLMQGKNLHRYYIDFSSLESALYKNVQKILTNTEEEKYQKEYLIFHALKKPSISSRLSGSYIPAVKTDMPYSVASNNFIVITGQKSEEIKFLLGLLNSKLLNRFYNDHFLSVNIEAYTVGSLPYPKKMISEKVVSAVNKILDYEDKFYNKKEDIVQTLKLKYFTDFSNSRVDLATIGLNEVVEKLRMKNMEIGDLDKFQSWFRQKQGEIKQIAQKVNNYSKEIDTEVYELYDL